MVGTAEENMIFRWILLFKFTFFLRLRRALLPVTLPLFPLFFLRFLTFLPNLLISSNFPPKLPKSLIFLPNPSARRHEKKNYNLGVVLPAISDGAAK